MKKSIKAGVLALLLSSIFAFDTKAQTTTTPAKASDAGSGIRLSIGADGGIPIGSLKDNYNAVYGGSVQADFPILKNELYATLNGGFNNIHSKDDNILYNGKNIELIPVKAGLKYFPVSFIYVQGEAGASFITNKNSLGVNKSATFVYAPQAGVLLNVGGKNYIDAGFRFQSNSKLYDGGKTNNFLGLRVAYALGL
jgi:hypothetical protein